MYPIDSQNYSVSQGLVLPRRPEPVRAVETVAPRLPPSQRLPQSSRDDQDFTSRVERFVRGQAGLADEAPNLRSRQALAAYHDLARDTERDALSLLIGIDTYA